MFITTNMASQQEKSLDVSALTATQLQQLFEWNQTQVDYPNNRCIHQLVELQVERTPDNIAVTYEQQQLSYRELNCRANQLANYLQTLQVDQRCR